MTEQDMQEKLDTIAGNLKMLDQTVNFDYDNDNKRYLNERQVDAVKGVLEMFKDMRWQLAFNSYKEIKYSDRKPIEDNMSYPCGQAVKINPCGKEYKGKTYFGILIGDVSMGVNSSIKDDVLSVGQSMHNPGILVPELGKIIYGCESWWGTIDSEEELKELITKETISNCWYMQLLASMTNNQTEGDNNETTT